jgi:2-oxoglutarate ferredoxin oxidoreductase subunit beta
MIDVTMHDGSTVVLKKLEHDYDPEDRNRAIALLEEANRKDWLITGLIYIDTQQPSLFDIYNLPDSPLNRLEESQMRPSPESIDQVNAMMFR